ncbi:Rho GTPase [Heterostelium album PN500]|uniref:Rho GTPase n=1 Tax=Heterostelium pallidum (strain ATCC 26659 / Pp 5 / PN500) TaxID=670386 RepID=D3BCH0_HETP5|nr:Rho GTPase [Heterostelium album PN500]EFA80960.1 Rho GTPase [Heterostelium album PN500]|eukprot:XP_020433078.1 Rho GTPase [Heterostelium album PN500]
MSSTTSTTTTTSGTTSNNSDLDQSAERTKKRDPGRITKVIKCGVVGDGTVGKTTLLLSYITQAFITEYTPTVFDNFSAIEQVEDGKLVNDTAGQDDYAQIRTTCYTNCKYDVFLLCYSVVNRDSFDNVRYKWLPELKANSPGTPFILVGTKTDMRDTASPPLSGQNQTISFKEGQKKAKDIKANNFMECTSKDPSSVAKVVLEAINIVVERDRLKRINNEKIWKKEVKKEEKEAKAEQKTKEKIEKQQAKTKSTDGSSTTTTTTTTTSTSSTNSSNKSPEGSPKQTRE